MRRERRGVTLLELLVVLAILGVMAGVTGLAFHAARAAPTPLVAALDRIAAARREAIATGLDVSATVMLDDLPRAVTAHADGRVVVDSLAGFDALTGRPMPEAADRANR